MPISKVTTGSITDSVAIDTDTFVVDGTNNRVGIGNVAPAEPLHISTTGATQIKVERTIGGNTGIHFTDTTYNTHIGLPTGGGFAIDDDANLASSPWLNIDTSGRVTMPYQPAFRATNAPATSTNNTLVYGTVNTNIGGHYNTSNGRFTAPVAGAYLFTMSMLFPTTGTSYARILFAVNGTASTLYADTLTSAGATYLTLNASAVIGLSAGDYVTVVNDGQITSYGAGYGSFCGYLIG